MHRLVQRQPAAEVLILEQSDRVGGKIQTFERAGFRVEAGPNGFLDSKPAALNLCQEIGLADRLVPASEVSGAIASCSCVAGSRNCPRVSSRS